MGEVFGLGRLAGRVVGVVELGHSLPLWLLLLLELELRMELVG